MTDLHFNKNYDMEAFPTMYKGILFRSKLEAKWAVFYDEIKVEWIYEPKMFELLEGSKYVPDFYFPKFDIYVEIKPSYFWLQDAYHRKRYEIFPEKLVVISEPYPRFFFQAIYGLYGEDKWESVIFCPNTKYEPLFYTGGDIGEYDEYFNYRYDKELKTAKFYKFQH